jgi:hypothetical protein
LDALLWHHLHNPSDGSALKTCLNASLPRTSQPERMLGFAWWFTTDIVIIGVCATLVSLTCYFRRRGGLNFKVASDASRLSRRLDARISC